MGTSSEEPWPQPEPKKRRLSNETIVENKNTEAMDIIENGAQASMVETSNEETHNETSKKKTTNHETQELETQREAMAKENKILREQNKIQSEQHQKMVEALDRNLNERLQKERGEMENQLQEMRDLLAQATE